MRICAVSDLHGHLPPISMVPPCDMFIIAGDVCGGNWTDHSIENQRVWLDTEFRPWLKKINDKFGWRIDEPMHGETEYDASRIIGIGGNHDFISHADDHFMRALPWIWLGDGECMYMNGIDVYGTPWVPTFGPWAWMKDEDELVAEYDRIWDDVEVLVTHGPAAGLGGMTSRGVDAGSPALRAKVEKMPNLKLHVFGHIHEAAGDYERDGVIHANVSYVDLSYRPRPMSHFNVYDVEF